MDARSWALLRTAFETLADLPPAARALRLEELAVAEPALAERGLRDELERMLRADDAARASMAATADAADATAGDEPAAPPSLPSRIGRYEVRDLLGRGGFGAVYRAFDPNLRREVAVKVAAVREPQASERFRREAEIAAGLVHPHIVTVHDRGETADGQPFLVQELLPGDDLDRLLARGEPRALADRERILRDVVAGLAFAHARGVVHRDVKPANVRVLPDGQAKLLDFGIARATDATSTLTQTGTAVGTLAFLAPEVLRGEQADAPADVWGLGALAFELLTFRAPFGGRSPAALVYDIVHGEPPRMTAPSGGEAVPPRLVDWVERCLARDPERRFRDAQEAQRALVGDGAVDGLPPRRRAGWLVAVAAVAAVALLVAATQAWLQRSAAATRVDAPAAALIAPTLAPAGSARAAVLPAVPAAPPVAARGMVVAVDARPWGRVVEIANGAGDVLPLPADTRTPLALSLPAGAWRIAVLGPDGRTLRRCSIDVHEVRSEATPAPAPACRAFFARPDVRGWVEARR